MQQEVTIADPCELPTRPTAADDDLIATPAKWYRGGTSKAFFVERGDLAHLTREELHRWISAAFGSPDLRQIDGIGGAEQPTSKFAILGPPTRPDADIDYSFFQVAIDSHMVATDLGCGNITAAVALYAVDNSYVVATDGCVDVRIHNTNAGNMFYATLEVRNGKPVRRGAFVCGDVPGTGAPITLDFRDAAGGRTGKLLPTGNVRDVFDVPGFGAVAASVVDIANLVAFVPASAFGLRGNENPLAMQNMPGLVDAVEWLRGSIAHRLGFSTSPEEALVHSPTAPLVSLVAEPQDWTAVSQQDVRSASGCDLMGRAFVLQVFAKTYFGTGSVCTGVAASIEGTVVNEVARDTALAKGRYRIAHPTGLADVEIELAPGRDGVPLVKRAALQRTARKLMEGTVFVPAERVWADQP